MKKKLLPVGTRIVATRNVGPVRDGQPGIITGVVKASFFSLKRPTYLCTFYGNVKAAMKPNQINEVDHGRSVEELEQDETRFVSSFEQPPRGTSGKG